MIRFIDVRGQGTGSRFAFWDTVTDRFVCISTEYAWDGWADFEEIAEGSVDLERYKKLCPDWVCDGKEEIYYE